MRKDLADDPLAHDCGHTFGFQSRYSPYTTVEDAHGNDVYSQGQMRVGDCRLVHGVWGTPAVAESATVCDDWNVLVHVPKPQSADKATRSTLMDVVAVDHDSDSRMSVIASLGTLGGKIYVPPNDAPHVAHNMLVQSTSGPSTQGGEYKTDDDFYDVLKMPRAFLAANAGTPAKPTTLEVCINDRAERWDGTGPIKTDVSTVCRGHWTTTTTVAADRGDWICDLNASNSNLPYAYGCIPRDGGGTVHDTCGSTTTVNGPGMPAMVEPYVPYANSHVVTVDL